MMLLKSRIKLAVAAVGLTIGMSACGSIFGPVDQRKVISYELTDDTFAGAADCGNTPRHNILYIAPMRSNAPYDTQKMYYAENPFELTDYAYSQWISNPTDMLTQSITKKVISACYYSSVAIGNTVADADFRLVTQLVNLRQEISADNKTASVKLVIYAQLINLESNKVVAGKVFIEQSASAVGPQAMVSGVNSLLTQFNNDLLTWLKQHS